MVQGEELPVFVLPANSPDIELTENLWGIFKRRFRKYYSSNFEELKRIINEVWVSVSPDTCDLIGSLLERMKEILYAKDIQTMYYE